MPNLDIRIEQREYGPLTGSRPTPQTRRWTTREHLWARALERGSDRGYDSSADVITTTATRTFLVAWRPPGSYLEDGPGGRNRRIVDESGDVWQVDSVDEETARRRHLVELRCVSSSVPAFVSNAGAPDEELG